MGEIVFIASADYLLTPTDYSRSGSARWSEHELLMRKPVSQFGGPGLEKISFSIILSADLGISPDDQLKKLRLMRDTGAVFPLVIGGKPVSDCYWRLDSLKTDTCYWFSDGSLQQCKVAVELTEYNDKNAVEENSITVRYGTGGAG
jgi:phage protein U